MSSLVSLLDTGRACRYVQQVLLILRTTIDHIQQKSSHEAASTEAQAMKTLLNKTPSMSLYKTGNYEHLDDTNNLGDTFNTQFIDAN